LNEKELFQQFRAGTITIEEYQTKIKELKGGK
jgi:hypothetical protein